MPPSIEELIVHPIRGPTVIGCNSRRTIVSKLGHNPTSGRSVTHLQPFEPIEPWLKQISGGYCVVADPDILREPILVDIAGRFKGALLMMRAWSLR
jgi:hypothetical protein